jgi:hypothetical protein
VRYKPKPGTGWVEGDSPLENVRRWRLPLQDGIFLAVSVAEDTAFVIARVRYGQTPVHAVPCPGDLGQIERDFGVHAWRIVGVTQVLPPSVGQCLMAKAVKPAGRA